LATDLKQLQTRLWEAADSLRANSGLRSSEYSTPVLGLIFLRYADLRFAAAREELEGKGSGRRRIGPADYQAQGVLYLHEPARFDHLLNLPEGADLGKAVNDAMRAIENANPDLRGVLPRAYSSLPNDVLAELLRLLGRLPEAIEGDGFGLIYEYFLGQFASSEGQKGGEFFTPTSIVKLIVEIIEPYHGKIYDPACGSGGMFVQSAHFVERHRKDPGSELSVCGQEKTKESYRKLGSLPASPQVSGVMARVSDKTQGDRPPGEDEPRRPRPGRRHPRGQHVLRGPPRLGGQVRLRHGQSTVQREQGRQGQARGRPPVPVRAPEA